MILEQQKEAKVLSDGEGESTKMSLDLDSAQLLMQMLSKNIYSDAIGSTVRETVSNALDSKRKSKSDKPVIVTLKRVNDNYEFSVEDFGTGLDHDDVTSIISKYGKSTKRDSNEELGMWGLGFKSPLAYSSSFTFVCRKEGIERSYMMYEGEETNTIDLLHEKATDEPSGVKVMVPVKYNDRTEFLTKTKEQLAYFEDVFFDVDVMTSYSYKLGYAPKGQLDNDFKIYRSENFQWSEMSSDRKLHICLDNVYYPIDFTKLGIQPIDMAMGLRFSLKDSVFPTINREAIRYTQEAKDSILKKIKTVATALVTKYNESVSDTDNVFDVFEHYNSSIRNIDLNVDSYNIQNLVTYSDVPCNVPQLSGVKFLDMEEIYKMRSYFKKDYSLRYKIENNTFRTIRTGSVGANLSVNRESEFYVYSDPINKNKKEYLKSITDGDREFITKTPVLTLGDKHASLSYALREKTFKHILQLRKHPKSEWRARIQEFRDIQNMIFGKYEDADKIDIPQQWLDDRKKKRVSVATNSRRRKLQGEINGKKGEPLRRFMSDRNCKFTPEVFELNKIHRYKGLTVYAGHDDYLKLDKLYHIAEAKEVNIRVMTFSNRELKILKDVDIHNFISYEKFMEGDNKPFKRLVTAYLINRLIQDHVYAFRKTSLIKSVSHSLYKQLETLQDYRNDYFYESNDNIYKAMIEVAETKGLYDQFIYPEYLKMKELLDKLYFINLIAKARGTSHYGSHIEDDEAQSLLRDLFKYHKHRLDYTNYNIKIDKEEVVEEV